MIELIRNSLFKNLDKSANFTASIDRRIQGLDELRGLAIVSVLLAHGAGLLPGAPQFLQGLGLSGVLLFFFISGYLITTILLQHKERAHFFSTFYIRRIVRIWPLMLVALIASAYLYPETASQYIYNLGLTNNYHYAYGGTVMERTDVMWSLAVEEHFYLLWPVIVYFTPRKHLQWVCLALVAIGFLFSKGAFLYYGIVNKTTHGNIHYIALGCGLALGRDFFKKSLILLAGLFVFWGSFLNFQEPPTNMPLVVFNGLWLLSYALVAQTIYSFSGNWMIKNKGLALFGKLCYGLYIIHFFITPMVFTHTPSYLRWSMFPLYIAISFALSLVSYKYFEVPVQNWRTPLEKKRLLRIGFLSAFSIMFLYFLVLSLPTIGR